MQKDIDILGRTIFGEARGESTDGQIAVGHVVLNRYRSNKWFAGKTIADTCQKAFQFSCWNPSDPNCTLILNAKERTLTPYWALADKIIRGEFADNTNGATHYHTKAIKPKWARGKLPCAEIGNHVFYKNID